MAISMDVLKYDVAKEAERIAGKMREQLAELRRRGCVMGVSGGIDSSTCAALSVKAVGKDKTLGLFLNEDESSDDTKKLGKLLADTLGIQQADENITGILKGARCYERRDEAYRQALPEYGEGWKAKIVLPSVIDSDSYRVYSLIALDPKGKEYKVRLPLEAYLKVVASTNFKQRTRKMLEYYHADRLNYAVCGTPNRLEYDQGFFVKLGDGAADVKPIAHLYKTQVYAMAAHLGVPAEILGRPPTTDTYSLPQSQEEFYFSLPYDKMDLCLWAKNHGVSTGDVAAALKLKPDQIERVYRDIDGKRGFAKYLHAQPMLIEDVPV